MKKIGIFGGTFNPPHKGHINSVTSIQKKLGFDKIYVVPTYISPLSQRVQGPVAAQRFEMTKILFANQNNIEVDDCEIQREGVSYTLETIDYFKKQHPSDELFLIVGMDQFENFDNWYRFEDILKQVDLIVTSRPSLRFPKEMDEFPWGIQNLLSDQNENQFKLVNGSTINFVQLDDIDISSTELRQNLRDKNPTNENISEDIQKFITEHELYQGVRGKIGDFDKFMKFCLNLSTQKKAIRPIVFDLKERSSICDYSLVMSGTSTRQAQSLAKFMIDNVKQNYGVFPLNIEGMGEGRWVVIDFGALIIHVFYDHVRMEYNLEDLWKSAEQIYPEKNEKALN